MDLIVIKPGERLMIGPSPDIVKQAHMEVDRSPLDDDAARAIACSFSDNHVRFDWIAGDSYLISPDPEHEYERTSFTAIVERVLFDIQSRCPDTDSDKTICVGSLQKYLASNKEGGPSVDEKGHPFIPIDKLPKNFSYYACNSSQTWEYITKVHHAIGAWHSVSMIYHSPIASQSLKCDMIEAIAAAVGNEEFSAEMRKLVSAINQRYEDFRNNDNGTAVFRLVKANGGNIFDEPNYSMDVDALRHVADNSYAKRDYHINKYLMHSIGNQDISHTLIGSAHYKDWALHDVSTADYQENDPAKLFPKLNLFYPFPIQFMRGDIVRNTITKKMGIVDTPLSTWGERCMIDYMPADEDLASRPSREAGMIDVYRLDTKDMKFDIVKENPLELEVIADPEKAFDVNQRMFELLSVMKTIAGPDLKLDLITAALYLRPRNFNLGES